MNRTDLAPHHLLPEPRLDVEKRARALHRYFLGAGGDPDDALLRDYDDAATRRKRMAVKWLLREAQPPPPPAPGAPRGKLRQGKENA